jgi:DnaD/phage-associated family protein
VLRHSTEEIKTEKIAEALSISKPEIEDALLYWVKQGILDSDKKETPEKAEVTKEIVAQSAKPSRQDVAKRGLEDPKLQLLLREAQLKFGRNLKTNEASTLVWLYDDLGLDVSLILLLLQYAKTNDRLNITFIEKTAVIWAEKGIENIVSAEKWISERAIGDLAWKRVCKAFSIEFRRPSEKEADYSYLWLHTWGLSDDLLIAAYELCVDTKSKFMFSYTAKVIENWHKKGYKTAKDIKQEEKTQKSETKKTTKYSYAGYDLAAFEESLNNDDD